jgi:hypothetical protein
LNFGMGARSSDVRYFGRYRRNNGHPQSVAKCRE